MIKRSEAQAILDRLDAQGRIVIEGEAKDKFVECLEDMLGGDPWQEGQFAIEILEMLK